MLPLSYIALTFYVQKDIVSSLIKLENTEYLKMKNVNFTIYFGLPILQ